MLTSPSISQLESALTLTEQLFQLSEDKAHWLKIPSLAEKIAELINAISTERVDVLTGQLCIQSQKQSYVTRLAFNAAILTSIMCENLAYSEHVRKTLIGAALTAFIGGKKLLNAKAAGVKLTDKHLEILSLVSLKSYQILKSSGVQSDLWIQSVLKHNETLAGKGKPQKLSFSKQDPASLILHCATQLAEKITPGKAIVAESLDSAIKSLLLKQNNHVLIKFVRAIGQTISNGQIGSIVTINKSQLAIIVNKPQGEGELIVFAFANNKVGKTGSYTIVKPNKITQIYTPKLLPLSDFWQFIWGDGFSEFIAEKKMTLPLSPNKKLKHGLVQPTAEFMNLLNALNAESDINQLTSQISTIPALCDLVLNQANGQTNQAKPITDLKHGLMMLGLARIPSILSTGQILNIVNQSNYPSLENNIEKLQFFMSAARVLSRNSYHFLPDEAALLATFWAIPCFASAQLQMQTQSYALSEHEGNDVISIRALFGLDVNDKHVTNVLKMGQNWQLPKVGLVAFKYVDTLPVNVKEVKKVKSMACVIGCATIIANAVFHSANTDSHFIQQYLNQSLKVLGFNNLNVNELIQETMNQYAAKTIIH